MQVRHKISIIAIIVNILSFILINDNSTSALTYSDNVNMQFTFNPTLSINVSGDLTIDNLTPGNYSDSNIITITTSTNNNTGFSLYANVGNSTYNYTDLKNGTNTFTNLSTNKPSLSNFDTNTNTWGYSYSVDNGTNWISRDYDSNDGSPDTGYNGLPLYSTGNGIKLASTDTSSTNTLKFKIGARSTNTQAAGEYTNTINFYATAHNTPTTFYEAFASAGKTTHNGYYKMQDMTTAICSAVEVLDEDSQTQLIDIRDNKLYWVAKLQDDHCWMTQNLDLDITSGVALTSETTDLSTSGTAPYITGYSTNNGVISWTPMDWISTPSTGSVTVSATTRTPNSSGGFDNWVNGVNEGDDGYKDGYVHALSANPGNYYEKGTYFNSTNCYFLQSCITQISSIPDTANGNHGHIGNYYNYTASIASNDSHGVNANYQENSICPANWRLPKNGDYTALNNKYNNGLTGSGDQGRDSGLFNAPLYLVRAGRVYGGTLNIPAYGAFYWSGTLFSSGGAYYLSFDSTNVTPSNGASRWYGFSLRCFAK